MIIVFRRCKIESALSSHSQADEQHYFYVLHCRDNTLYAGYTKDLERRLQEHNLGKGAKYTRPISRRPATMIFAKVYLSRSAAMKEEYAFKQLSRREKEHYLETEPLTCILPNASIDHSSSSSSPSSPSSPSSN